MNDFISTLTHGRRLQAAIKELSANDIHSVIEKLQGVLEKRKEAEKQAALLATEKKKKAQAIKQQLDEAGLAIEDLQSLLAFETPLPKKTGQKRPIKYKLVDATGAEHPWTGIGRMPRVYREALENGKSLNEFSILS